MPDTKVALVTTLPGGGVLITPLSEGTPTHPIAPGGPPPTVGEPGFPTPPIAPGGPPPTVGGGPIMPPPGTWPGGHPDHDLPGHQPHPGHPLPPVPPNVPQGDLLLLVYIPGHGAHWIVVDTDLKPTHPIVLPPPTVGGGPITPPPTVGGGPITPPPTVGGGPVVPPPQVQPPIQPTPEPKA